MLSANRRMDTKHQPGLVHPERKGRSLRGKPGDSLGSPVDLLERNDIG